MILCRECGNSAPSTDGFCSSCGALLDWSGERVETRILPTVQTAAPTPVEPVEAGPVMQGPRAQGPVRRTQSAVPESAAYPPGPQPQPRGWIPAAEARRAQPVPAASEPEHTGPYCQACGVRNPQERRFCRSCGAMLQLPVPAPSARRGWWRRLIDRLTGRRRQYAAGQRPGGFRDHQAGGTGRAGRRGPRLPRHLKLGRLAPLLIIAGLAGIGLGPARTWVTNEVSTLLGRAKARVDQHYANVTPVGASAASAKDHAAALAIDGLNTTYWASAQHPDGVGEALTVSFAAPVDIDQIGILSGADAQNFRAFARPRVLVVTAAGAAPVTLSFDDSADFQSRGTALRQVTTVTITVKDAYPGQKQHALAIRDLEFFVKSG
ncbi:zinc ribbon domain-containing protein [Actinocrinis puniceicyclus]|uniref:Zinc ribbon domain-containing protein n=1 Tax=Actinocrinis puniceicyclus TaxID=977794 RepID=A0A8J7WR42_9ACTN|nr:zinc ribbon domain-containing protein [Actinocrinis puniceicyclus]MBS2964005.1 zinc ribbon domain-containing protein [Actinocrinis puniceicyclus]